MANLVREACVTALKEGLPGPHGGDLGDAEPGSADAGPPLVYARHFEVGGVVGASPCFLPLRTR
jgi:hypothetical protein